MPNEASRVFPQDLRSPVPHRHTYEAAGQRETISSAKEFGKIAASVETLAGQKRQKYGLFVPAQFQYSTYPFRTDSVKRFLLQGVSVHRAQFVSFDKVHGMARVTCNDMKCVCSPTVSAFAREIRQEIRCAYARGQLGNLACHKRTDVDVGRTFGFRSKHNSLVVQEPIHVVGGVYVPLTRRRELNNLIARHRVNVLRHLGRVHSPLWHVVPSPGDCSRSQIFL